MTVEERVKSFADKTSMHGAAKVILSKSPVKRFFWLLIFVGAWTMFISQTALVMIDYFSYPKKVSVAVVKAKNDRVPFPDVTVCNSRPLDFYSVKQLEDYYRKYGYDETLTKTGNSFVDAYTMTAEMSWRLSSQVNENASWLDVTRSDIKLNILPEILSSNIISKEEFIVQCRFQNTECEKVGTFKEIDNHYYFRCFTYTAGETTLFKGPEEGLSLILMTGNGMLTSDVDLSRRDEYDPGNATPVSTTPESATPVNATSGSGTVYIPGLFEGNSSTSGNEGIRVVVHPPNTVANPIIEGLDVPPGYSVSLGLKPKRYIRVKKPHGDCVDENPFVAENRFFAGNVTVPYRQIDCELMCHQMQIIDACSCYDFSLNLLPNMSCRTDVEQIGGIVASRVVRICDFSENNGKKVSSVWQCGDLQVYCNESASIDECRNETVAHSSGRRFESECIKEIDAEEMKKGVCSDRCPFPCSEYDYDITYSLSKWPAKGSEKDAVYFDIFDIAKYMNRFQSDSEKYSFYTKYMDRAETKVLDDFVRLNVYWLDNKVVTTEESALYSLPSLISDIGGQFGIWIGVSVITLSELMELIFSTCMDFLRRGKKKRKDGESGKQSDIREDTTMGADNDEGRNGTAIRVMRELIECLKKKENSDICRDLSQFLNNDEDTAEHRGQSLQLYDDAPGRQPNKEESVETLLAERN